MPQPQPPGPAAALPDDALWSRLSQRPLDDPRDARPLSARLRQLTGWSPTETQRVLTEYRRFLYLAVRMSGRVCPSVAVDEAWHAHLLDSRRYFGEFCPQVLGRVLHHVPSRGGAAEGQRHRRRYRATLRAYRLVFGHAPPADLWPEPDARMAEQVRHVSRRTHWVLPRPGHWLRTQGRAALAAARTCASAMRPLAAVLVLPALLVLGCTPVGVSVMPATSGPDFLRGHLVALLALMGVCLWRALRGPRATRQPVRTQGLDATAYAYLAGGALRAVQTAVAELLQREVIALSPASPTSVPAWRVQAPAPRDAPELARAVHARLASPTDAKALVAQLQPALDTLHAQLYARGLLTSPERARRHRTDADHLTAAAWCVWFGLGAARLWHGLQRDLPVGWLVLTLLAGAVLMAVFHAQLPCRLTREAASAVHRARKRLPRRVRLRAHDAVMPWGLALLGASALHAELDPLRAAFATLRPADGGGSGCGATGCSGSGDGDGDGGCGGCGG